MKKCIFIILVSILTINVNCQTREKSSKFYWNFENTLNGKPQGWNISAKPDYSISLDSLNIQSGKYSILIESTGESCDFQSISFTLPNNYDGHLITLSSYIKTENVTDGYAGLWMRIDPRIAFDNMNKRGITGTNDWAKYEITLPMDPTKTTQIAFGGILSGKGKMWINNLTVTIDGKNITDAKIFEKEHFPAEQDKKFDNGSGIIFPLLNKHLIANLELLGKLWGFLKYYHFEVGKGNYNWDYELFRILPIYLKVKNSKERDKILLDWINKYGEIPVCTTCKEALSKVFIKPDITWVEKSIINNDLKKKIKEIYSNRYQGDLHYYIKMMPLGNPYFSNENPYNNMLYPDAGFRLLALYRYWNMIQYFFPSKYLTDNNWNNVLEKYIPLFISAKDQLEYDLAVLQIVGEINDTHANLYGNNNIYDFRGYNYAPFRVQFVEKKLVVTDYYNPEFKEVSGLKIGDIITHINGKTIKSIIDSIKNYYPASNETAKLRDISEDLLRSTKDSVNIKYISLGVRKRKELSLYQRNSLNKYHWYKIDQNEKCYKFLNRNIGYISLATITDEDVSFIKELFKHTKGIIIDIRNYPSSFVPFTLGSFFVSSSTPFVKFTQGNVNNPGEFTFMPAKIIPKDSVAYKGKLIVIVNELTQSQAEYTAMAFRAGNRTTIIGSQTAGADGDVSDIVLPGGLRTMISGLGVYYPDGKATQRIGIKPDIEVKPTIKGIKEGRDELLEKAIELIKEETK